MGKKICTVLVFTLLAILITGCVRNGEKMPASLGSKGTPKSFKVGVVLGMPGRGGQWPGSSAAAGMKKAEEELGIEYKVLNQGDLVDDVESLRYFAENEYDLVIAVGPQMAKSLNQVAEQFKDIRFVIIDDVVNQPNVTSVIFNEEHGGFLAGAAAASLTKTNRVGFIGGSQMDEEETRYQAGFLKGIQYINSSEGKSVKAYVSYAGVFADALVNPEKGKQLAYLQYSNGADIIFQVAGQTGNGVYTAAKEARKFVIGNDAKQAEAAPWNSYGVTAKRVDYAVYSIVKAAYAQKLKPGVVIYGMNNQGMDYVNSSAVPPEVAGKINLVKAGLAKGSINLEKIVVAGDLQLKLPEPGAAPQKLPPVQGQPGLGSSGNGQSRTKANSGTGRNQKTKPERNGGNGSNSGQPAGGGALPTGQKQPVTPNQSQTSTPGQSQTGTPNQSGGLTGEASQPSTDNQTGGGTEAGIYR
ncbi:basic membrane lipoprotein [Thermincola ferriacetica]|uniref:Basic membrane lipoprotein n=1 Tax=Thermincola ferriacetica TaxID=281456 RepID=A0A0L6W185_9FIRM|nr:BMP family ABC transporter substrate-binding protein [Thermincola ferriacetica]KNZ69337.1 basic membrane lipoprotein [Thermincola ferriacetica]